MTPLIVALLLLYVGSAASSTVRIDAGAPNGTLLNALVNPAVTDVVFEADYHIDDEFEAYAGVKPELQLTRNVTLRGAPGQRPLLDLNYQYAVLEICSNCTFEIRDLALGRERRGTGVIVDFFVGQPGSVLLLNNTYRVRPACTSRADSEELVQNTARSPRFPGPPGKRNQQITGIENATYDGVYYPDSLLVVNTAMDVPLAFQELRGLQGGFTLVIYNTVRLCANTVSDDCLMVKSPEACVNEMIDALLSGSAASSSGRHTNIAAIVAPVVIAVVLLAAAAAAFVLWRRRRHSANSKVPSLGMKSGGADGKDLEAGNPAGRGPSQDHTTDDQDLGPHTKGWTVSSSSTAPQIGAVSDERIQFGVLLGAGSFGKVYRGWWAGRDVAIKVIEHDKSSASAVENEVVLMLSFDHPNIVRAYHYVTYTLASNASNTLAGGPATLGDTTTSSSSLNMVRGLKVADGSSSSNAAQAVVRSSSLPSSSNNLPATAAVGQRKSFSTSRSTLAKQQQQHGEACESEHLGSASRSGRPSPLSVPGQQQQQDHMPDRPGTPIGPSDNQQQQQQAQQLQQQQQGIGDEAIGAAAAGSSDQQQQQCQAETGAAVHPGNPLPGGEPSGSNEFQDPNEWVIHGTPLSERIDTSRWPGIIDCVSAATGYSSKDNARAKTWLVLEYCDLGTLSNIVSEWSPGEGDEEQMILRLVLLQDTAKGLQALHSKNVVHGDLNARNVLVSSCPTAQCGMVAKLADLGLSRVVKQHKTHRTTNTVGTMSHMPPELLRYGRMSAAVDVFAFGVMMWEVYTGQVAFRTLHYGQFFEMVVLRNQRPPVPASMPEDYALLMERCWSAAPGDRPSVDMLLQCITLMISDRVNRSSVSQHFSPATAGLSSGSLQHDTGPLQQQQGRSGGATLLSSGRLASNHSTGPSDDYTVSPRISAAVQTPQNGAEYAGRDTAGSSSSSGTASKASQAAHSSVSDKMAAAAAAAARARRASTGSHNKMSVTVVTDLQVLDQPQRRMSMQEMQKQQQSSMQRRMSLQEFQQQQMQQQQQGSMQRRMSLQEMQQQNSLQQQLVQQQLQQQGSVRQGIPLQEMQQLKQQQGSLQRHMSLQEMQRQNSMQQHLLQQQGNMQRRMSLQESKLEPSDYIESW